jgi:hypothetical protein
MTTCVPATNSLMLLLSKKRGKKSLSFSSFLFGVLGQNDMARFWTRQTTTKICSFHWIMEFFILVVSRAVVAYMDFGEWSYKMKTTYVAVHSGGHTVSNFHQTDGVPFDQGGICTCSYFNAYADEYRYPRLLPLTWYLGNSFVIPICDVRLLDPGDSRCLTTAYQVIPTVLHADVSPFDQFILFDYLRK